MQSEFAFDRLQSAAPKAVKPLLAAQATEYRLNDGFALATNLARLNMLDHEAQSVSPLIFRVAFDAPSVCQFRTVFA